MNRRRQKRPNWFLISLLVLLIAGFTYMDRFIIPTVQSPFVPTATATPPPEQFITQAQEFLGQGKLTQAIAAYQQAQALKPNDPSIYVELAQVQVLAGNYKDAQTSAEDALLLNANLSEANAVRASALDWQGNYLEAEAAVKRALELDPNNADAHAYYSEILTDEYLTGSGTSTDVLDTAITESKTALSLAPNSLEAHRAAVIFSKPPATTKSPSANIKRQTRSMTISKMCIFNWEAIIARWVPTIKPWKNSPKPTP